MIEVLKSCHGQVQAFSTWLSSSQRSRRPWSGRARISVAPACHVLYLPVDAMHGGLCPAWRLCMVGNESCSSAARRRDWRARRLPSQLSPVSRNQPRNDAWIARISVGSVVALPSTWNSTEEGVSPRTQACSRLFPFSACCRTQSSMPLRASEMAFALRCWVRSVASRYMPHNRTGG